MSLDLLGAEPVRPRAQFSLSSGILALGAAFVGMLAWRRHPVLGALGAAALASNVNAVARGDRNWKDAVRRVGRHAVATAGSLAMPAFPGVGYVAGAIAGDLLLARDGDGVLDELAEYVDVDKKVIDVVEVKPGALVKV